MSGDATTSTATFRPAVRLAGLEPYRPGPPCAADALVLNANEGPDAADCLLDRIRSIDAESLRRYPRAATLEAAIAARLGVGPGRVVATAGGDDAIDRLCRVALEPGRTLVSHAPTFEMIERGARLADGAIRRVPWMGGPFPVDGFVGAIGPGAGLVAIVSPNNPTGGVVPAADLARVAAAASTVGALVLADLAYVEFADEDPTPMLLELDNVVVVRTFSKAFGLAGLRVGCAVASEPVARWLRTVGGPYPVSSPALALAGLAIEAGPDAAYLERVRRERGRLVPWLAGRGVEAMASQGNFVLARLDPARLAERGVVVRGFGGEMAGWSRITVPGDRAAFERLLAALEEAIDG